MAKAKIGRNAPCPCGSGKKFKNCCLPRAVPPTRRRQCPPADPWAARVDSSIRRAGTPHGTPVPSIILKGYRFRAVGSRLHSRPPGETFHEFIVHQVKWTLGKEWHDEQIKRPPDQRHQILKWFDAMHELLMRSGSDSGKREGVRSARASGDAWALLTLAYDIFHLLHRGDLPGGLADRLRKEDQFQGARYEVAVCRFRRSRTARPREGEHLIRAKPNASSERRRAARPEPRDRGVSTWLSSARPSRSSASSASILPSA